MGSKKLPARWALDALYGFSVPAIFLLVCSGLIRVSWDSERHGGIARGVLFSMAALMIILPAASVWLGKRFPDKWLRREEARDEV